MWSLALPFHLHVGFLLENVNDIFRDYLSALFDFHEYKLLYFYFNNFWKQPPEVFYQKGVPENFAKFTGKHLCQSLFFNKVAEKETLAQVFSCEFCKIFKNTFFTEHLRTTASVTLIKAAVRSLAFQKVFIKQAFRNLIENIRVGVSF